MQGKRVGRQVEGELASLRHEGVLPQMGIARVVLGCQGLAEHQQRVAGQVGERAFQAHSLSAGSLAGPEGYGCGQVKVCFRFHCSAD